jgi:ferredoxin, 2Fe-2S
VRFSPRWTRPSRKSTAFGASRTTVDGDIGTVRPRSANHADRRRHSKCSFGIAVLALCRRPLYSRRSPTEFTRFRGVTRYSKESLCSMAKITFIDASGQSRTVEAQVGATVMETALRNSVPGIEAECGGACACATCHVYVDPEWTEATGKASQMEEDMLDFAFEVRPNSRLSCQIKVSEALDGLIVTTPPKQG